ncbi:MAG: ABC-2 type transport system ATP-binding protein [Sphingobacteriales bacterium]|jgi:ABC-2 type transport system ATP-binding protein
MILSVKGVKKSFGTHTALNGVDLEIPKRSIFGLLGPNGAGKTTLLRIINQILAPDEGTVLFNGQPLQESHIQQIGYLPEERGLYKKMKIGEQAIYLARLKGLSRTEAVKRLKYWFEKFEITDWWDKKVEELSKGMGQKVQFITTVMHEPELLILDEPFSGFDPINIELIQNEILELNKKGVTIIFSTHRMESVDQMCDHIALINQSKCILTGTVEDVRNRYRNNTYKLGYSGELNEFPSSDKFEVITHQNDGKKGLATLKIGSDNNTSAILDLLPKSNPITYLEEIIPSIHDIFVKSVKEQQS